MDKQSVSQFVAERIPFIGTPDRFGFHVSIGHYEEGKLICGVVYNNYRDDEDIDMNIAADSPKWATRANIRKFFEYPFYQLRLNRVSANVLEDNVKCRRLVEGVGFKYEGTKRNALMGKDVILYGMLKSECFWLTKGDRNGKVQPFATACT